MAVEIDYRRMTTTNIYADDLVRLNRLKQDKPNRRKHEPRIENAADVVSKALDALERERVSK